LSPTIFFLSNTLILKLLSASFGILQRDTLVLFELFPFLSFARCYEVALALIFGFLQIILVLFFSRFQFA